MDSLLRITIGVCLIVGFVLSFDAIEATAEEAARLNMMSWGAFGVGLFAALVYVTKVEHDRKR